MRLFLDVYSIQWRYSSYHLYSAVLDDADPELDDVSVAPREGQLPIYNIYSILWYFRHEGGGWVSTMQ